MFSDFDTSHTSQEKEESLIKFPIPLHPDTSASFLGKFRSSILLLLKFLNVDDILSALIFHSALGENSVSPVSFPRPSKFGHGSVGAIRSPVEGVCQEANPNSISLSRDLVAPSEARVLPLFIECGKDLNHVGSEYPRLHIDISSPPITDDSGRNTHDSNSSPKSFHESLCSNCGKLVPTFSGSTDRSIGFTPIASI